MNVMVYNKYKELLMGLNIEVMKSMEGVYNVDEIIDTFTNFYYDKMILDITAIRDYQNTDNLQKLAMNINMENVIVEEDNGEIVVTNLLSLSFPIIRYRLGDSIQLAPKGFRCPCGREHPVLLDVLGRVGKRVVGKQKRYPSLTFYYVFKNLMLRQQVALNYQAMQHQPGKVLLKIEQPKPELLPLLRAELNRYFSDDIDFEIKWGETLHTKHGKLKDFITTIA